jgi:glycolate oxidase FAD binding subunit
MPDTTPSLSGAGDCDHAEALAAQVRTAAATGCPLAILGSGSKQRLGRPVLGTPLDVTGHRGIVHYDPIELVLTARCGTPLHVLEPLLAAAGQHLPFEPPHWGPHATLGGCVATGLSGPRRPWSGAVRDYLLGIRLLTATGEILRFGGEVMKNVAGYDVSRLMVGAQGTLGILLEVSLKVWPRPVDACALSMELPLERALAQLAAWGRQPLPLTGAAWQDGRLYLRLEGGLRSVQAGRERLGGEDLPLHFWEDLREQRLPFFQAPPPPDSPHEGLWRLSVPMNAPALALGPQERVLYDWAGAQRWLRSPAPANDIRTRATRLGGHATCLTPSLADPFAPLAPGLARYHQRLKQQLDPQGLCNPGRLYPDL